MMTQRCHLNVPVSLKKLKYNTKFFAYKKMIQKRGAMV